MKKSPIKLRSSSKAKLRATKSPSNPNEQSQILEDQSKLRASVHTIPAKESPNPHNLLKSNFTTESINYAKSQPYNNVTLRSGSPHAAGQSPSRNLECSQQLSASRSFHQLFQSQHMPVRQVLVSPQKSVLYDSVVRPDSVAHIVSPIKSGLDNERSFMRVELGRKVASNEVRMVPKDQSVNMFSQRVQPTTTQIVTVRPKMVSPPKVVRTVQRVLSPQPLLVENVNIPPQVSAREIELERKVKILENRINELYTQKNQIETQMNEANIRLQYENNFLKEKVDELTKRLSKPNSQKQIQSGHVKQKSVLSQQASERLIKELQKSQENEYHQSKEIHNLRQKLLETEEMLSKEISKSLSLLEELTGKEKEHEEIKEDLKRLKEKLLNAEQASTQSSSQNEELQITKSLLAQLNVRLEEAECEKINFSLQIKQLQDSLEKAEHQNSLLAGEVQELRQRETERHVTKDLMHELQQNNNLLISAIRSLQTSLKQNETELEALKTQKTQLQLHIEQLQEQIGSTQHLYQQQGSDYQREIQQLAFKLEAIEVQLSQKNTLVQKLTHTLRQQSTELQQRELHIKSQQTKIEELLKSHEEANSSTANSFHKKLPDPCTKCDQLRKTIIKLNSHLNKSSSTKP